MIVCRYLWTRYDFSMRFILLGVACLAAALLTFMAGSEARPFGLFFFGPAALVIGGIATARILRPAAEARAYVSLLRNGTGVVGEVVDCADDPESVVYNGIGEFATRVRLDYAFTGPDGIRRSGRSPWLPKELGHRFGPGSPIGVVYDPARPERHAPDVFGLRNADLATQTPLWPDAGTTEARLRGRPVRWDHERDLPSIRASYRKMRSLGWLSGIALLSAMLIGMAIEVVAPTPGFAQIAWYGIGMAFVLSVCFHSVGKRRWVGDRIALLRHGVVIAGDVIPPPPFESDPTGRRRCYAFTGPDGVRRRGQVWLPWELKDRFPVGARIGVACDEMAPSLHTPDVFELRAGDIGLAATAPRAISEGAERTHGLSVSE